MVAQVMHKVATGVNSPFTCSVEVRHFLFLPKRSFRVLFSSYETDASLAGVSPTADKEVTVAVTKRLSTVKEKKFGG